MFRYRIRVTKGNSVVKDSYVFSQFYLTTDMPKELSFTLDDLTPETEYSVVVTAYDSWDNISEPLAATFTTPNENDLTNSKDGSLFINNGQLGLRSNDLNYNGNLSSGKWHRVLFVVRDNVPMVYLDGVKVGQASSANAAKARHRVHARL